MPIIHIQLDSLQHASMSDEFGILELRAVFGDDIVDGIHAELPHLEPTLSIAAHRAELEPVAYIQALYRKSVAILGEPDKGQSNYDDLVIDLLIAEIDPDHESDARWHLKELLSNALTQILEDRREFASA